MTRSRVRSSRVLLFPMALCCLVGSASGQEPALGVFEGHADVGAAGKPGAVEYDPAQKTYLVAGGGENMWSTNDAFHFVWKRASGDVSLAADIRWIGTGAIRIARRA